MSIKKLKKLYCKAIGAETFRGAVCMTLIGIGEYIFLMYLICDWIRIVVTRGY